MATGKKIFSLPLEKLRTLLSTSAKMQSWTGTATPVLAAARIHIVGTLQPLSETKPYVILGYGSGGHIGETADAAYEVSGGVKVWFVQARLATDGVAALVVFMNTIGEIVEEILALSGTGGFFSVSAIDHSGTPFQSELNAEDPQMSFAMEVHHEGGTYGA